VPAPTPGKRPGTEKQHGKALTSDEFWSTFSSIGVQVGDLNQQLDPASRSGIPIQRVDPAAWSSS
jgi:hypothetical protein